MALLNLKKWFTRKSPPGVEQKSTGELPNTPPASLDATQAALCDSSYPYGSVTRRGYKNDEVLSHAARVAMDPWQFTTEQTDRLTKALAGKSERLKPDSDRAMPFQKASSELKRQDSPEMQLDRIERDLKIYHTEIQPVYDTIAADLKRMPWIGEEKDHYQRILKYPHMGEHGEPVKATAQQKHIIENRIGKLNSQRDKIIEEQERSLGIKQPPSRGTELPLDVAKTNLDKRLETIGRLYRNKKITDADMDRLISSVAEGVSAVFAAFSRDSSIAAEIASKGVQQQLWEYEKDTPRSSWTGWLGGKKSDNTRTQQRAERLMQECGEMIVKRLGGAGIVNADRIVVRLADEVEDLFTFYFPAQAANGTRVSPAT